MAGLPPPYEPFVDTETGKITEVWYRYLDAARVELDAADSGAAKAWGHITLAGTVATITSGYNIATAATTATGLLSVGLTVPFASTTYVVTYGVSVLDTTTLLVTNVSSLGVASTGFSLVTKSTAGNANPLSYYISCFGDQ